MAEPQLLVDQAQRLVDRGALLGRDLDVGEGEELQHLVLGPPHAAQLILRPAAGRRGDDLALGGALARPAAGVEILLENLDRSAVVALFRLLSGSLRASPPAWASARAWRLAPAAGPATLASSAAIRAFRISFSSRAAAAIALTASNSSRPTKSTPPIHSRIFSRIDDFGLAADPGHGPGDAVHHLHEVVEQPVLGLHRSVSHDQPRWRARPPPGFSLPDLIVERGREAQPRQIGNHQPSCQRADAAEQLRGRGRGQAASRRSVTSANLDVMRPPKKIGDQAKFSASWTKNRRQRGPPALGSAARRGSAPERCPSACRASSRPLRTPSRAA